MSKSDIDEQLRELKWIPKGLSGVRQLNEFAISEIKAIFDAKFEACLPEKDPRTDLAGEYDPAMIRNFAIEQIRDNWYKGGARSESQAKQND